MSLKPVSRLFFGGVPTEPQVRALMEAFGARGPGESVSYSEIMDVIQVQPRSSRFRSVVSAWRRRLRKERNIVTTCISGSAVQMLRDEDRALNAYQDGRRAIKGIGKAHAKAADIPVERLTEPQRNSATHVRRVLEGVSASARAAANELAVTFAPPKQLPRVR